MADFIDKHISKGFVLVHCREGRSRSCTCIVAYAMKYLNMNLKEAYTKFIDVVGYENQGINTGFQNQLMEWDQTLNNEISMDFLGSRRKKSGPKHSIDSPHKKRKREPEIDQPSKRRKLKKKKDLQNETQDICNLFSNNIPTDIDLNDSYIPDDLEIAEEDEAVENEYLSRIEDFDDGFIVEVDDEDPYCYSDDQTPIEINRDGLISKEKPTISKKLNQKSIMDFFSFE
eukprot:TRINITY_DN2335_c0_g1_i1.p1 TRINITY_DN2335_c0_g1~~TRINITY_DN2335_c0_g1_i1.p1  ORF type:complete len:229 (-),score=41.73 TRINITY_DN2335_c0_g1_i1:113-799(-)